MKVTITNNIKVVYGPLYAIATTESGDAEWSQIVNWLALRSSTKFWWNMGEVG